MNSVQPMTQDDQKVVDFSESPGRRLRVQRQSRGIEVERVAAQLHLRVPMVEALEQDRYADLPGPVFVAGYLRNYARLLGLDPDPLISAYRAANPEPEPTGFHLRPAPRTAIDRQIGPAIGSGHILVRIVSLGLLAAVLAMIVLWWQNRAEQDAPPTTSESSTLPLATTAGDSVPGAGRGSAPAQPVTDASSPTLPIPAASGAHTVSDQGPDQAPAQVTPPQPSASPAGEPEGLALTAPATTDTSGDPASGSETSAPAQPPEVALSFTGPAWVKVRDASGALILNGQMRKGETRVLTGDPPYSFNIGSVANVQVTVGGQPLDLSRRSKGSVARFKFDPRNPE